MRFPLVTASYGAAENTALKLWNGILPAELFVAVLYAIFDTCLYGLLILVLAYGFQQTHTGFPAKLRHFGLALQSASLNALPHTCFHKRRVGIDTCFFVPFQRLETSLVALGLNRI